MDTGTYRSDPRSTGLNTVERKCHSSVRKSRSEIPKREKKKFCVSVHTGHCCSERAFRRCEIHSLWLRCPHGRSGQWKRAGLPVAERVLSAELRGENHPPEYRCVLALRGSFLICSLPCYFWIIFRKKTKKLGGGFLDREGEKSRVRLFTTASLYQLLRTTDNTNRFIFTHL